MVFENEEEFKDRHGIYAIANKINSMVYIGQTRQRFKLAKKIKSI